MPITLQIPLQDAEKAQLARIVGCPVEQLDDRFASFGLAAVEEYIRMFLGQKVFSRAQDIKEYRLFLLVKHAMGNQIPPDRRVCELFQCTSSEAKGLIGSVMSKYQYDLREAIDTSIRALLQSATQDDEGGDWEFTANTDNLIDQMNRELATIDGTLPQVKKKFGTVSNYQVRPSSKTRLDQRYGVV